MNFNPQINQKRYGRLTIIGEPYTRFPTKTSKERKKYVLCRCDCGNTKEVMVRSLIDKNTKSCGCIFIETVSTHRLYKNPLYSVWSAMRERCSNSAISMYYLYGGRGITVCDEWTKDFKPFYDWAMANGWQKGLQLDRINNDGNYEPSNCRLVTPKINARNRRTTKLNHDSVLKIRTYSNSGLTHKKIGELFGVSQTTVTHVFNKKYWADVS